MDATKSSSAPAAFIAAEPAKRVLDPSMEWRDCANQWDVTEVWNSQYAAADSRPAERAEGANPAVGS